MGLFSRRRRDASRHPVPDGWIGPHGGAVTHVGNLDSPLEATVDARGLVGTGGAWSIDWWIGADDRWHVPAREVAVRQRLVDDAPVVETAMRVPSGDVVQRVFAVRAGADELVVVEWENQSPVPVALAVALRPYDGSGAGAIHHIEVPGDTAVVADGSVVLLFPKPPNRASSAAGRDVADVVLVGEAAADLASVTSADGQANAAYVWPLAHRTTFRVAVPLGTTDLRRLPSLPTAEQVVNGWKAHGGRGVRLVLPDERLGSAIDANRRALLFRHDAPGVDAGAVAGALDRYGYAAEAAELLASDPEAAGIAALAGHWRRHRDEALARSVVEDVAHLADGLRRGSPLLVDAAELLDVGGEPQAAASARKLAGPVTPVDAPRWPAVTALLDAASPTWSWPELSTAARFLTLARDLLVHEVADGLVLLGDVPEDWYGRGIEVHDAPTAFGTVSYGIRWHGDRPALLWELDPHPGVGSVTITVPGLDPAWTTTERRGDALLGPVLPPGTKVTLKGR